MVRNRKKEPNGPNEKVTRLYKSRGFLMGQLKRGQIQVLKCRLTFCFFLVSHGMHFLHLASVNEKAKFFGLIYSLLYNAKYILYTCIYCFISENNCTATVNPVYFFSMFFESETWKIKQFTCKYNSMVKKLRLRNTKDSQKTLELCFVKNILFVLVVAFLSIYFLF